MKNFDATKLAYYILDPSSNTRRDLLETTYQFWKQTWTTEFGKVGRAEDLNPDDFFRQNLACMVMHQTELVSMHLYSFFDLSWRSLLEHSYFHGIKPETVDSLQKRGITNVMSLEYLGVNGDWRKSQTGIPFGDVMISLGQKVLEFTKCDAAVGTARTDVKVDRSAVSLGFSVDQFAIQKYDYECSLVVSAKGARRPHPDAKVAELVEFLWKNRQDASRTTTEFTTPVRKVA